MTLLAIIQFFGPPTTSLIDGAASIKEESAIRLLISRTRPDRAKVQNDVGLICHALSPDMSRDRERDRE